MTMILTNKAIILFVACLLLTACGANESVLKSGKETPAPANSQTAKSSYEQDLDSMKTADFRFVYVLRRKDGGSIDAEDRGVIKVNTVEANRRISSDNGKAFLIGTNTLIPPEKMTALYQRFAIEDLSPPVDPSVNGNSNASK
jgi:hypothetical protein